MKFNMNIQLNMTTHLCVHKSSVCVGIQELGYINLSSSPLAAISCSKFLRSAKFCLEPLLRSIDCYELGHPITSLALSLICISCQTFRNLLDGFPFLFSAPANLLLPLSFGPVHPASFCLYWGGHGWCHRSQEFFCEGNLSKPLCRVT